MNYEFTSGLKVIIPAVKVILLLFTLLDKSKINTMCSTWKHASEQLVISAY